MSTVKTQSDQKSDESDSILLDDIEVYLSDSVPHKRFPREDRRCAMCGNEFNTRGKPSTLCHSVYRIRISRLGKEMLVSGNFCSICLAKLYESQAPKVDINRRVEYITPAIRPNGTEIPAFPKFREKLEETFLDLFQEVFSAT